MNLKDNINKKSNNDNFDKKNLKTLCLEYL